MQFMTILTKKSRNIFTHILLVFSIITQGELCVTHFEVLQLINPKVKIITVDNTPDDPRQRKPDNTKAKELLGWEPKIKLRDGLPFMVEDFRKRLGIAKGV
uniref:Putative UDP-glucuronate decarboxylase n=1 Tax=Davidia involucrata TaxID=16924 RepID=A0A5B7BDH2_DAVIN